MLAPRGNPIYSRALSHNLIQNGLDVLNYELQLLEKVEENVLYVLDNEKELSDLERRRKESDARIKELLARIRNARERIVELRKRDCA